MESCRVKNRLTDGKDSPKSGRPKIVIRGFRLGGMGTSSSSSSRHMTTSRESLIKSKCLKDGVPPLAPSVTKVPEKLEKYKTVSPPRRSYMCKKIDALLSSSSPKQLAKESSIQKSMGNKEKEKKDERSSKHEFKKAPAHMEPVGGIKRKKMTARTYRAALFQRKTIKETIPVRADHSGSGNNAGRSCEPLGKRKNVSNEYILREVKKLRDESSHKASDTIPQKLNGSSRGLGTNILGKKTMVDPDTVVDVVDKSSGGGNRKHSRTILDVEETSDDAKGLPTNPSPLKNVDIGASESLLSFARSRNDVINSKETAPSPPKSENHISQVSCMLCSKEKRNSPEMEVCSCRSTVDKDLESSYPSKCPKNNCDSSRNCSSAQENCKEPSTVDDGLHFSSFILQEETKLVKNSANGEHVEGQILLQRKLALKDKDATGQLDDEITKIRKKCERRMKKLVQKQQEEIKVLRRDWDDKRLQLEADHKLESALILSIHHQSSAGVAKLKKLDDDFARKIEEHEFLKDAQLKDLEAQQIAARNVERLKAAHWLDEAKACCSGEQKSALSLESPSGDDARFSQSSTNNIGTEDAVPIQRQHTPDKSVPVQENDVAPVSAPPDTENAVPIQNQPTLDKSVPVQENDVAPVRAPPDTEIAVSIQRPHTPDKSVPVQENDVVPVSAPPEEVCCIAPIESPSNLVSISRQDEVCEQFNISKHLGHDEIVANVPASEERAPNEIQLVELDKEVPTGVSEMVPNELMDHVDPVEVFNDSDKGVPIGSPNSEVNQRDGVNEVINDTFLVPEQILEPSVAPPPSCVRLPEQALQDKTPQNSVSAERQDLVAPEVENRSTSPFEVASPERIGDVTILEADIEVQGRDTSVVECQSTSHIEDAISENVDRVTAVHPVRDSPAMESQHTSQNSVAVSQTGTLELPDLTLLQLGMDVGHLRGSGYLAPHPIPQVTSWNSPSLVLQNELEIICKKTEQLEKGYKDKMSRLESDYEKELQELRNKYEVKRHDTEAEFRLKKNELHMNQNKIFKNKVLAEIFVTYCSDLQSSSSQGEQQGIRSGLMHMASPSVQAIQQLSLPHSTGLGPARSQNVGAPPVQAIPYAAHLSSGAPSRPLVNRASNHRFCLDNHSPALYGPHANLSSISQHLQLQLTFQNWAERRGGPIDWLVDMNRGAHVPGIGGSPPFAEIFSTFGSSLQHTQNHPSSAVANGELVCLSDDE